MKMKLKIIASALAASLIIAGAIPAGARFNDVDENSEYKNSIELLADCGVLSGTGGGDFNPYGLVTRAEMAKIAAMLADAPEIPGNSLFSDVSASYWANGYINAAAQEGILTGYIGGYFAPYNNLTYAEAITIALRLLGYNSSNLSGAYPDAYIRKAAELKLTQGMYFDPNAAIDRQSAAYILANAYTADCADGGKLLEKSNLSLSDECVVLFDYQNSADEILTSAGAYSYNGDKTAYIGKKVKLITDTDNSVVGLKVVSGDVKSAVIAGIAGNEVTVADGGVVSTINIPNASLIYYEGAASSFSTVKGQLSAGDRLYYTLSTSGAFTYGASGGAEQPVMAGSVDLTGYTLIKNSAVCASADSMDAAYIYPDEMTAILYDTKTSGMLQSAFPSKNNAESITVSGISYDLSAAASAQVKNLAMNDTVTVVIGRNNEAAAVYRASAAGSNYGIESVTGNEISCYSSSGGTVLKLDNTSRVIYGGKDTTFGAIKSSLGSDLQITVYKDANGAYDYAIIEECELSVPVVASADGDNPYSGAKHFIRGGKRSSASAIRRNDVLYYSEALETVYAYCDTALGVYEEAYPNQQNPTSIKLSGKLYEVETSAAAKALANIDYNQHITLLLGRDGGIAALASAKSGAEDVSAYGVVLSCGRKTVDGVTDYYLTCLNADGTTTDFKTNSDRSHLVGSAVHYDFKDAYFAPAALKNTAIGGAVDMTRRKIGDRYISDNCKIIDITYVPDSKNESALAHSALLSDITRTVLAPSEIKAAVTNSNGEIIFLALKNVTYTAHELGIITKSGGSSAKGDQINIGGSDRTLSSAVNLSAGANQPVAVQIVGNRIVDMRALNCAMDRKTFISANSQRITAKDAVCDLGKNAVFYVYSQSNKYRIINSDDIGDYNISSVSVYTDTATERGGVGRVVVLYER